MAAEFEDACEVLGIPLRPLAVGLVLPPRRPRWNGCGRCRPVGRRANRSARIEEPLRRPTHRRAGVGTSCPLRVLPQLRTPSCVSGVQDAQRVPCDPGGCLVPSAKGVEPIQAGAFGRTHWYTRGPREKGRLRVVSAPRRADQRLCPSTSRQRCRASKSVRCYVTSRVGGSVESSTKETTPEQYRNEKVH